MNMSFILSVIGRFVLRLEWIRLLLNDKQGEGRRKIGKAALLGRLHVEIPSKVGDNGRNDEHLWPCEHTDRWNLVFIHQTGTQYNKYDYNVYLEL